MPLTAVRARQAGGIAGILFVIVGIVSLVLPGSPPQADETSKISSYLADKHDQILASNYLVGIAFVLFLLFAGALRAHLGAADREGLRPGAVMLGGAVATTALILGGTAVMNGAAFQVAAANDTNLNHALYDVASDMFLATGFTLATFAFGATIAIAATRALPNALAATALAIGVIALILPIGFFVKSGFFAIGGAYGFIAPALVLAWVLATSAVLLRPASAPAAIRTEDGLTAP